MVSMHFPLMMGGGVIWNCSRFKSDLFMCLDMQFAWPMPQCIYASNCWAILIRIESNAIFGQRIKRSTDRIGFKLNSHSIFSTNIIYIMVLYTFVFCFHVRISISRFLFLFCLFVWSIQRIRTILYIYAVALTKSCIRFSVYTDSSIILRTRRLYSASIRLRDRTRMRVWACTWSRHLQQTKLRIWNCYGLRLRGLHIEKVYCI